MLDDNAIPFLNVHRTDYPPVSDGDGIVLYKSPDGTRLAGSFKESGAHTMTMPYDEFIYLVAGSAVLTVHGGKRYDFSAGDAFYVRQGMTIDWELSEDFHDVTVLVSNAPLPY